MGESLPCECCGEKVAWIDHQNYLAPTHRNLCRSCSFHRREAVTAAIVAWDKAHPLNSRKMLAHPPSPGPGRGEE